METYRNFLAFIFKGALTVGLVSSLGYTILQILKNDVYLSPMMSIYVAMVGGVFGTVAASAGFCTLFPLRRHKQIGKITYVVGGVLMALCLAIFFGRDIRELEFSWMLLFFPILPATISLIYFRRLVAKHVQAVQ